VRIDSSNISEVVSVTGTEAPYSSPHRAIVCVPDSPDVVVGGVSVAESVGDVLCAVDLGVAVGGAVSVVDLFGDAVVVVVDLAESVRCVVVGAPDERLRQPVVRATAAVVSSLRRERRVTG
jgi:hypothetical protein